MKKNIIKLFCLLTVFLLMFSLIYNVKAENLTIAAKSPQEMMEESMRQQGVILEENGGAQQTTRSFIRRSFIRC